ncbi:MAG: bifunctional diaminohydroxyphosphoribosylaminopyrimidine deaminase/5-amino-6-(5-phosphoribosylamino)uracil reductase RibD [Bacteroidetes bacterium]|nr:bifunctional diaminohydroxyphosphoribosylaminopyrimidine deaminase/5-amino-6-(5-phosphoribosylamino)uracil reductase RibD [Bacteroidota bacterium]
MNHEFFMQRCIELARNGRGSVAPNPMVGALVLHQGKIIGEGYHQNFGAAHAEVNAINSVKNKNLLAASNLYVSLEPCNHFGKTPPCTDLILQHKIPHVIIGAVDTNAAVAGKGIKKLKDAGVTVTTGILEEACIELNKRFFYFNKEKKPYVILKWAQSTDGYIGDASIPNMPISDAYSQQLVHKWRSEEAAILVGTTTAALDNPSLTVRNFAGKNPLRVLIDRENKLKKSLNLFDQSVASIVFTKRKKTSISNLEYVLLPQTLNELNFVLGALAERNIQSLFVEGGAKLLQAFIDAGLWNETRIFTSPANLGTGIKAPLLNGKLISSSKLKNDTLVVLKNDKQ